MKKILIILGMIVSVFSCNTPSTNNDSQREPWFVERGEIKTAVRQAPFSRGVNFSGWFETWGSGAESINFTKYTEQDFADVKSIGADVVRLPVHFHHMTSGAPNYIIDPLLLRFLDLAVDWAEKHGLYIIIDNHSFDPVVPTPGDVDKVLLPVWAQIAQRYRNRNDFIVYEILNEPHGIADSLWGEIQGKAIETIRRYDQNKYIIAGGTEYNSIRKLFALPHYTDSKLIYTFHFYDPYIFTHQGETWGGTPTLSTLAGVPFPYDRRRMPKVPDNLRGTWVEGALLHDYHRQASPAVLLSTLDRATAFSIERDVPIFCGEFGVFIPNSLQEDRVRWYEFTVNALNNRGIAWTSWDYYGGFGIFNDGIRGDFNSDLNVEVVRAMGFTPPVQVPRQNQSLKEGFVIYDDFPNRQLSVGSWGNDDFSLYDTNSASGEYAIRWGNARQYNIFYFSFDRNGNFANLVNQGYILEFQARTQTPVHFDVRFVNPEGPNTMPWRMHYTIDRNILPPDGRWHTIRIPLAEMREQGAWTVATQEWHSPKGEFSWENIKQLEFVAEHGDMTGQIVWFDNIRICIY